MHLVAGFALAALIGLSLGLLGGGGSILTVPILVYVLGFGTKNAIAMSLPIVGVTSAVGAVSHWRAGRVDLRAALVFGGITMVTSYVGARLAVLVSADAQLALLAAVMILAAASLLRNARKPQPDAANVADQPAAPLSLTIPLVAIACGVGLLTGLVGIGGGFLVVPALVILAGLSMRAAIGTSLVVIAMNSLSGSLGYVGQADIPWAFVAGFASIAVVGILIGTHLVRFVSQATLKQAFAVLLLATGGFMLFGNRPAPRRAAQGSAAHSAADAVAAVHPGAR
jgi:uncharacterized membrane protein YfcA